MAALKAMSVPVMLQTLESGSMQTMAALLTSSERLAVTFYLPATGNSLFTPQRRQRSIAFRGLPPSLPFARDAGFLTLLVDRPPI
jgi:hypothetical protein